LTAADTGESFIADNSNGAVTIDGGGTANQLVSVNGANNVTVEGFNLQNTEQGSIWTSSDTTGYSSGADAIWAQDSTGDNFDYNSVDNVGIAFNLRGVSGSQVEGNDITNVQQGVNLQPDGGWITRSDNNDIESNSITNVNDGPGVPQYNLGAIDIENGSNNNQVSNNYINGAAGEGIDNIAGADGNSITGNTVENTNTAAVPSSSYDASFTNPSDSGAIYAWQGAGSTNNMDLTIANNYVKNAGQGFENIGIYLDDGVNGANVTGNIVQADGSSYDLLVHGGSNDTLQDNVVDLTSATGSENGLLYQNDGPQMTGDTVAGNIFYANGNSGSAYSFLDNANDTPAIADNLYFGGGLQNTSADSSAVFADPQFENEAEGDYQVAAGSPASALGA